MKLDGLHAIVTGGGRGIGAATAEALTRHGATVTVLGRSTDVLVAQVAAGSADGFVQADVADQPALERAFAEAVAARGAVDILVNNAGAARSAPFLRTSDADFRAMLEVNLLGAVSAARLVLPAMLERGFGRIINVASTASLKGYPYVAAYVAAKHAVLGFTRALALEVATKGVAVNAVCPGFTDTDMSARSIETIAKKTGRDIGEARADLARNNPQRRLIDAGEVAAAIVFLASREAAAINGAALSISGGEI